MDRTLTDQDIGQLKTLAEAARRDIYQAKDSVVRLRNQIDELERAVREKKSMPLSPDQVERILERNAGKKGAQRAQATQASQARINIDNVELETLVDRGGSFVLKANGHAILTIYKKRSVRIHGKGFVDAGLNSPEFKNYEPAD